MNVCIAFLHNNLISIHYELFLQIFLLNFFRQKCQQIPGMCQMLQYFSNIAVPNVITNVPIWKILENMLRQIMIYQGKINLFLLIFYDLNGEIYELLRD